MTHDRQHQVRAARLRLAGAVAAWCVAGLLVGCANSKSHGVQSRVENHSRKSIGTVRATPPPFPVESLTLAARATERTDAARSVIVAPPKPFVIAWDKGEPGAETEVWQTKDLRTWELVAAVAGDTVTLPKTNAQAFYKIRHRLPDGLGGYVYSDWCRNQK